MTPAPILTPQESPDDRRFGLLVFGAALLVNFYFFTVGWGNTLLGHHEFRQVQTAISCYYYLRDGISLHYITPLLGPPWEIPLEFPFYQASVAAFVRLTGMELDQAGRLVSWLYFLSALPACYGLLRRFQLSTGHRLIFLALLLVSPIYLFYSRAFLIESTAFAAGAWFLLGFARVVEDRAWSWWPVAVLAGAAAGAVKITTLAVFLVPAVVLMIQRWRQDARDSTPLWRTPLFATLATLPAVLAGLGWSWYAGKLRAANPDADFMQASALLQWTFGDFTQRLSWTFWMQTFRVWSGSILSEAGLAVLVISFAWLQPGRRRLLLGFVGLFLSGQLIFSNVYWIHDYYFYANSIFLLAALGFAVTGLLDQPGYSRTVKRAAVAAILLLQLAAYDRSYFPAQAKNAAVPELTELVRAASQPDDIIVVLGHDWDGALPYYAERRSLMLMAGRERDPASIKKSIDRLDPKRVAAVIIVGAMWRDVGFIHATMDRLQMGESPFFFNGLDLGIWVPLERQVVLRDSFDLGRFPSFRMAPSNRIPVDGVTILAHQISRQAGFESFQPRPVRAHSTTGFAAVSVDYKDALVTHATTELVFRPPGGAKKITAMYGLDDKAYTGGNRSDGIDLTVTQRRPDGRETELFRRYLNPRDNPGDRGPQQLNLALPSDLAGELIVRVLPGPHNDPSFDWAYFGQCNIR
jgi:hypothetical protein